MCVYPRNKLSIGSAKQENPGAIKIELEARGKNKVISTIY